MAAQLAADHPAKRLNDDVEALVMAVGLDVPLEDWRGMAPARRLLASWANLRAP